MNGFIKESILIQFVEQRRRRQRGIDDEYEKFHVIESGLNKFQNAPSW